MEQLNGVQEPELKGASQFYDKLAADYDTMTGFDKRFVHERPFFNMLLEKYSITALDAGAGTGFHSLLLAELGVEMTAVDVSKKMLERVKAHAKLHHVKIDIAESSFQDLSDRVHRKFDAVLCMGNSLPHLSTHKDLEQSLKNFSTVLNPGGLLFLQILNYNRILAKRERVQSVKEMGGVTFVRFYEFHRDHVIFNILKLKKENGQPVQELESVRLRPILKEEMVRGLQEAGFSEIHIHGSIMLDDFHEQSSKDLVVLARKPIAKG
jgi:glycine/sarcosine N-methyltransferase